MISSTTIQAIITVRLHHHLQDLVIITVLVLIIITVLVLVLIMDIMVRVLVRVLMDQEDITVQAGMDLADTVAVGMDLADTVAAGMDLWLSHLDQE